jgi:inorganic pyrophosphatase
MRISFPRRCVFEHRKGFPFKNYGEIPNTCNKADGDPWDVFAPGYHVRIPEGKVYRIQEFLGIYMVENGNHKLAVRVDYPGFDRAWYREDIRKSCEAYSRKTKLKGVYIKKK